ncbi:MAG: DUF4381 domain-containing protein [Planctomycetota bacterium]
MLNVDPYSLDQLRDIVEPPPASWWPPADGWFYVSFLILVWSILWLVRGYQRWRRNAYRREAIAELNDLTEGDLVGLSRLLKRVALVGYPRRRVASLVGTDWTEFLSRTCPTANFDQGDAVKIGTAGYVPEHQCCGPDSWQQVRRVSALWIRCHRPELGS